MPSKRPDARFTLAGEEEPAAQQKWPNVQLDGYNKPGNDLPRWQRDAS